MGVDPAPAAVTIHRPSLQTQHTWQYHPQNASYAPYTPNSELTFRASVTRPDENTPENPQRANLSCSRLAWAVTIALTMHVVSYSVLYSSLLILFFIIFFLTTKTIYISAS